MFKHHFLIFWRFVQKNKSSYFVKVLSLFCGITCALLLAMYIHSEYTYDNFLPGRENVYRITSSWQGEKSTNAYAWSPNPVAIFLGNELPEVEKIARIQPTYKKAHIRNEKVSFLQEDIYIADSAFVEIFPFKVIYGSTHALGRTHTIILTESLSNKIYGQEDPTGKILTVATGWELEVGGVIGDLPDNTHLKVSALISWKTFSDFKPDENWYNFSYMYVKLRDDHNIVEVEQKLAAITEKSIIPVASSENYKNFKLAMQPFQGIHLTSDLNFEMTPSANVAYIQIFFILTIFFLVIASFNFINIATATATVRAKEIGLRKVHGASNSFIRRQFFIEAIVIVVFSVALSGIATFLLLPAFSSIIDHKLSFSVFGSWESITVFVLFVVLLTLVSGLYPAFIASKTNLSSVVKGFSSTEKGGQFSLRKGLIVLQIAISTVSIIATGVIFNQIEYISNKQLGFQKDNVVVITLPTTNNYPVELATILETELTKIPSIEKAGNSQLLIGMQPWRDKYSIEGNGEFKEQTMMEVFVDHNFIDALGINIVEGRNFDIARPADFDNAVIINEALARESEWSNAIGKKIRYGDIWSGEVIGVVKDFHASSLHEKIEPMVIRLPWAKDARLDYLYLRINGSSDIKSTMSSIERQFKSVVSDYPFEFTFLDYRYEQLYKADAKLGDVLTLASIVIVFISCLGILSLSTLMVQKMTREVGIRKVLGAGSAGVAWLYLRSFVVMTIIGNIIAWPLVFWIMNSWLENFEYHSGIDPVLFAVAATIGVLAVSMIVSVHSIRLSRINPIHVLKME